MMTLQEQLQNLFLLLQAIEPVRNVTAQLMQILFIALDFVTFWLGFV